MGLFSSPTRFAWKELNDLSQLDEIFTSPAKILIFKHSTRCSISSFALKDFERNFENPGISCYFLDLLKHRDISTEIALRSGIHHESPQVLVFEKGKTVYEASHHKINTEIINHI